MKRVLLFFLLIVTISGLASAQSKPSNLSSDLILKERQKWEALKAGRWLSLSDMFAEEFLSIGYEPDGSVRMTTKAQSFSPDNKLPPGIDFSVSDFKVVMVGKDSAVVTYTASGPIKVFATSVWAKRGREWKTVFYQASMIR